MKLTDCVCVFCVVLVCICVCVCAFELRGDVNLRVFVQKHTSAYMCTIEML
jgi:hypothetical protein